MYRKTKLCEAISLAIASGSVGISSGAFAQDDSSRRLDEIVVTATKRTENLQDVPVAVQAIDTQMLHDLNIQSFNDWVMQAPNVNFDGRGPGQNRVYMRGITTGGTIYSSGRSESTESVAFYIDEAAMTSTGRNMDVYLLDVERIEVLPGPQGTLYGQSSEAGTIRVVTNKPKMNEWEGMVQGTVNSISHGGTGYGVEGVLNIPIVEDKFAVRAVGYNIDQAGWIDNVPGTISFSDNIYMPLRPLADGAVIAERDNSDSVEKDFNTATYTGGRLTGRLILNDDWELTAGIIAQNLAADGVFEYSPDVGDLQIRSYEPETLRDDFVQFNWTLDGRLGMLDMVYAGAYIDEDIDQHVDYNYAVYDLSFLPVYNCTFTDGFVELTGCAAPDETFHFNENKKRTQHELRFSSDLNDSLSFIGGIWYADDETLALQEWMYSAPGIYAQNEPISGARTFYPPRPPETAFWNEILQESDELAFFGELTYDFTDQWSATIGLRRSMIDLKPWGSFNFATRGPVDTDSGGSLDGFEKANQDKTLLKANLAYRPTEDMMFYATYSEGFRRGGFNRQGAVINIQTGEQAFPAFFKSDMVDNYEIGWKLELFDNRLRFNGAAFYLDWTDQQIGLYDPPLYGNVAFTANLAGSEIKGVESNFTALLTDNLTMSGALTFLDGEITDLPETGAEAIRPVGSDLARVPSFSGALNFRYDFRVSGIDSFATLGAQHVGSMLDNLSATVAKDLDAYTLVDASVGVNIEQWQLRLIGSNLTDERPELSHRYRGGITRIRSGRPRVLSLRVTYDF
jgi:outer membrane receptor protein involved in Fe transport